MITLTSISHRLGSHLPRHHLHTHIHITPTMLTSSTPSSTHSHPWVDTVISMDNQISKICKCSFYHLRNIANIGKFISSRHCETLCHAFITVRIDHCNSLLTGLDQNQIKRLQHVQKSFARLLTGTRKQEHITPVLKELHWLPSLHASASKSS